MGNLWEHLDNRYGASPKTEPLYPTFLEYGSRQHDYWADCPTTLTGSLRHSIASIRDWRLVWFRVWLALNVAGALGVWVFIALHAE
jgi:hypothetical protein